jgi:putative methyltransferase (TIGR04325 family)
MRFRQSLLKNWLPPVIVPIIHRLRRNCIRFEGSYENWEDAFADCTGYDAESILANVLKASLKVKRGEAVYERDSVLFDSVEYSWPVTAGLMLAAAQNAGRLDLIDFGGALGSSYFQNQVFLNELTHIRWSVIEQLHYVRAGREHIADENLRFYETSEQCLLENQPNAVLFSGVLQYLPEPRLVVDSFAKLGVDYLIIDRTPFLVNEEASLIKVQRVPSSIYAASYPCWFFNMTDFIQSIEILGYKKIVIFNSLDKLSDLAIWQGLIFKRTNNK